MRTTLTKFAASSTSSKSHCCAAALSCSRCRRRRVRLNECTSHACNGSTIMSLDLESKIHVLRSLSVGTIGENTENRLLQLEPGSFRWWSELRPIKVLRIGCRTQQILLSFTGEQWWELGHSQDCAHRLFGTFVLKFPRTCLLKSNLSNQLVSQLMRGGSPILEQLSSSPPCHGGVSLHTMSFFKFVTVPVSASYSRVRLTTVSNCSTVCGPDTNIRWSSITVARIASGFEARTNFATQ